MTEVVKFNIGGQKYKVSRSLLQMHSDSMLAKSASDQWQKDPEAEISIEGDGSLFRYVLTYLRHGTVSLPITESKEALMKELEYYGIEVDKNAIDEKMTIINAKTLEASKMTIAELKDYTEKTGIEYHCAQLALDCIHAYMDMKKKPNLKRKKSRDFSRYLNRNEKARENAKAMYHFQLGETKAQEGANVHLNSLGLHLSWFSCICDEFDGVELEEIDTAQRNKGQEE